MAALKQFVCTLQQAPGMSVCCAVHLHCFGSVRDSGMELDGRVLLKTVAAGCSLSHHSRVGVASEWFATWWCI